MLTKVISGGQTGADFGALLGARDAGLETGGFAPLGWRTERGADLRLPGFGLVQTDTADWKTRTRLNVWNADATLIICPAFRSAGSVATYHLAARSGKPFLQILNLLRPDLDLATWLDSHEISVLNVAGNRESVTPGIEAWTRRFIGNLKTGK